MARHAASRAGWETGCDGRFPLALTVFYYAAAIAALLAGAGLFWALYQLAVTLQHVRQVMLPQVELTLTEVQRNLNAIDTLTQDVDTTVEGANQLVASANRTVQTVGDGLDTFNRRVATPLLVTLASAMEGARAGVNHLRERRARRVVTLGDTEAEGAPVPQPAAQPITVVTP